MRARAHQVVGAEGPTCPSCIEGDHECAGADGLGRRCACGCNVEPWPFYCAENPAPSPAAPAREALAKAGAR